MILLGDEKDDKPMKKLKQDVINIDRFEPNQSGCCELCGERPTVMAVSGGNTTIDLGLCGPHLFGDAAAINPKTWNEGKP